MTTKLQDDPEAVSKVWRRVLKRLKDRHGFTGVQINQAIQQATKGLTAPEYLLGARFSGSLCVKCGACCRFCDPILLEAEDIMRIASHLKISVADFHIKYVKTDGEDFSLKFTKPCGFLRGNLCKIYSVRPMICRAYPFAEDPKKMVFEKTCNIPLEMMAIKAVGLLLRQKLPFELNRKLETYVNVAYQKARALNPDADELKIAIDFLRNLAQPENSEVAV